MKSIPIDSAALSRALVEYAAKRAGIPGDMTYSFRIELHGSIMTIGAPGSPFATVHLDELPNVRPIAKARPRRKS